MRYWQRRRTLSLCAAYITAGVGESDIPAPVVGTRDNSGCDSSGQGNNVSNGETHVLIWGVRVL
jgi:hypothetical protein